MAKKPQGSARVWLGDCVEQSHERLKDNSVDLIVTDPPYGIDGDKLDKHYNRDESFVIPGYVEVPKNDYAAFSSRWISEAARVLRPNGSMYIVSGWTNLKDMSAKKAAVGHMSPAEKDDFLLSMDKVLYDIHRLSKEFNKGKPLLDNYNWRAVSIAAVLQDCEPTLSLSKTRTGTDCWIRGRQSRNIEIKTATIPPEASRCWGRTSRPNSTSKTARRPWRNSSTSTGSSSRPSTAKAPSRSRPSGSAARGCPTCGRSSAPSTRPSRRPGRERGATRLPWRSTIS